MILGSLGKYEDLNAEAEKVFIYTHYEFKFKYNENQVSLTTIKNSSTNYFRLFLLN
jgi:hypothetical protein